MFFNYVGILYLLPASSSEDELFTVLSLIFVKVVQSGTVSDNLYCSNLEISSKNVFSTWTHLDIKVVLSKLDNFPQEFGRGAVLNV